MTVHIFYWRRSVSGGKGQNREVISHSRKKFAQENESYVEVWWLHCLVFALAGGEEDRLCARQGVRCCRVAL